MADIFVSLKLRETAAGHLSLRQRSDDDDGKIVVTVCGQKDRLLPGEGFSFAVVCRDCYEAFAPAAEGLRRAGVNPGFSVDEVGLAYFG